jgi:hypothetical protein
MSGVPSGGNTFKNIAIGVVTTVVAYLIVHFIFDKKDKNKELNEKKEKMETAWNSVNGYINTLAGKLINISCFSCDPAEMKSEMIREIDQMNSSLRNIKETGELDDKMKSIIDRTIQQFADEKPVLSVFFDSMSVVKTLPKEEQVATGSRLQQKMLEKMTHIQTRDSTEFKTYLADINKKYKTHLVAKEQKEEFDITYLPGKWRVECTFYLYLYRDHTFLFSKDKEEYKGRWKLDDKNLVLSIENEEPLIYTILQLSSKIMLLYLPQAGMTYGACPQ